jgi:hypothetical protein
MPAFAFVAPVLPGKDQLDADAIAQAASGADRDAYVASRRAAGVSRVRPRDGGAARSRAPRRHTLLTGGL